MQIIIPKSCPSCESLLENVNGQLFCRNKGSCPAQSSKTVENFCKKMKIKGFGEKTVEKLEINTIVELYTLTEPALKQSLGDKVGSKLFLEIQKAMSCEFSVILGSLGIPLIGKVAAEKLATQINCFSDITPKACESAGLGPKAIESLSGWLDSPEGSETSCFLDSNIEFKEVSAKPTKNTEHKFDVCVTGKLNDFSSRNKAADYLGTFGIGVKGSVTKTVKYLICEDDSKKGSSSYKKAVDKGIEIVSIKQLINIVTEN